MIQSPVHQLGLRLLQRCPTCQSEVPHTGINVLHESEDTMFAHVSCERCFLNHVAYIVANPQGIIGNAVLTDQTYQELIQSEKENQLSEDGFLEIYRKIHDNTFINALKN